MDAIAIIVIIVIAFFAILIFINNTPASIAKRNREFFLALFPEVGPSICDKDECNRKTVRYSKFCVIHHYEMVKKQSCPWAEQYSDLSESEKNYIQKIHTAAENARAQIKDQKTNEAPILQWKDGKPKCPSCGSVTFSERKKFSKSKAVGGAILAGPVGLGAGLLGKRDIILTCLKCKIDYHV